MKRTAVLVAMLGAMIVAAPATADTTTFLPAADAYVNGDPKLSSRNYGTATTLQVDDKPKLYSYLRFDVRLPDGATPTGATLRLYTAASSGAGFTVHQTDGATWTETGITYNSRPAIQLASSIGGVPSWSSSGWKAASLSLTPSSGALTVAVRTASATAKSFHSRENVNDPQLVVSYDPAPPPPSAQCADGVDNDADGQIDLADPGCTDAADDSESPDPAPPPPPTPNPNPLPPPASGALWGAYVASNTGRTEASTEALIGRRLAIFKRYRHWDHNPLIPAGYKTLAGQGRTLLLTIDAEADTAVVPWSAIASGAQDATIDRFAAEFRAFASPLFVVFHHEPENDPLNGTDSEFAAAFRHFFERLEQQGVTNVSSVWNMMGAKSHFARYQTLYPGDDVVDWVAWDEYNWAGCNARTATWLRPVDTFDAVPWWNAQTWHGYKPQMEAEYGSHESSALGDKGQWFRDVAAAAAGPLADVKAWVYFDSNHTSLNGCAWHVDSSASSLSGFTDAGLSPVMNP